MRSQRAFVAIQLDCLPQHLRTSFPKVKRSLQSLTRASLGERSQIMYASPTAATLQGAAAVGAMQSYDHEAPAIP